MEETKIKLSALELAMLQDADLILTKNAIIEKTIYLFSSLAEMMRNEIANTDLPLPIKSTEPKISKGENYNGLPYVMLDYPRHFTKGDIFAIRNFCWWGNEFSTTLHLKGAFKELFQSTIKKNIAFLAAKNFPSR